MFAPKIGPQAKAAAATEPKLHPARPTGGEFAAAAVDLPDHVRSVVEKDGHPLDGANRTHFQAAFGHDFGSVHIHSDDRAAASAASLSARAYTVGSHIVFGGGQYAPHNGAGRRLIAHELAHVVQQSRGGPAPGHRGNEAAADMAARRSMRGGPVPVAGGSAIGIACKTLFEEFTDGKYMWSILKAALEHTRPIDDILADLNSLGPADRAQAQQDITKERAERDRRQLDIASRRAAQTDPKIQAVADPILIEGRRVAGRMDAVLMGLRGVVTKPIPGWNFTPDDHAKLQGSGKKLTMAQGSGWFPAQLQQNLLNTLDLVLGPTLWPSATGGVNAMDFFHGHLVIKKDKSTDAGAKKARKEADKFEKDLDADRDKSVGELSWVKKKNLTADKIPAYKAVLERAQPSLAVLMENTMKIPGAAVMYHTYEFNQPDDLAAKGQKRGRGDPRRHYVTPLSTNTPEQYTPPNTDPAYEDEYTVIVPFSFLIDSTGAVHVRPMRISHGIPTTELSTITGTEYELFDI